MKHICIIVNFKALLLMDSLQLSAQTGDSQCSLSYTVDTLSFLSNAARTEKLRYANELLRYENYKKSFLPSFWLTLSPVSFNRSLRLLQQASDGRKQIQIYDGGTGPKVDAVYDGGTKPYEQSIYSGSSISSLFQYPFEDQSVNIIHGMKVEGWEPQQQRMECFIVCMETAYNILKNSEENSFMRYEYAESYKSKYGRDAGIQGGLPKDAKYLLNDYFNTTEIKNQFATINTINGQCPTLATIQEKQKDGTLNKHEIVIVGYQQNQNVNDNNYKFIGYNVATKKYGFYNFEELKDCYGITSIKQ